MIQIKSKKMKRTKLFLVSLLSIMSFTACNNDDTEEEKPTATIDKIELGLGNNETAVIAQDFHFNAEIVAADKIADVQIKITQKNTETYTKAWSHKIIWTQYAGAKNATVHKHFDIPADAAEGKYDFNIIVNDQNGSKLEVKKNLTIYKQENLPLNPVASVFTVFLNDGFFYRKGAYKLEGEKYKKGDLLQSQLTLTGIKGSGKMYLLLIRKNANHNPESIDQIDFSKVIVYDVYEHKDMAEVGEFSNVPWNGTAFTREMPQMIIGAAKDNNIPVQDLIANKAWASGDYIFKVLYKNTTYNINFSQSINVPIAL
ncbi:MAG: DUF4625 domain-containing protein [Flavobacterium sp.]|nr:MAG: DUF4625 domain-containing protein [Flavobacterium sp.]